MKNQSRGRVLITDGAYKHTLGAVRSLACEGFEVDVIGHRHCLSGWSRYLSNVTYPQEAFNDQSINEFAKFLDNASYDVLLPIGARSVQLVSRHRSALPERCSIPLPSGEVIALCLDKEATYNFAATLDVNIPKTWVYQSQAELEEHISEIVFPIVVKGKSEINKDRPFYAYNASQLLAQIKSWGKGLSGEELQFPIIQQFIDGVGVGFFALYKGGECKRVFMHQRVRETPPSGGASCCAVSIYESDLLAAGRKILDAMKWHGVAMVEFKREKSTGDLYLMEINPKFWGSLDLALACGVDFPVLSVRLALGEEITYSDQYRVGLKFHWPLDGELAHIREKPNAVFRVILDCLNPGVKSNLRLSDPLPAVYSIFKILRSLIMWMLTKVGLGRFLHRTKKQGLHVAIMRAYSESTGIPIVGYSRITPQIYVGAQHSILGKRKMNRLGISAIVNMRSEFNDEHHDLVLGDYCYLPIEEFKAPKIEQLQQGVAFVQHIIENGGKIYIHCSEGISRAPTLAVAYFISQGMPLSGAVALIQKSRPFVNILPNQMERLNEFADMYVKGRA